jgi:hypothetical protein
MGGMGGGGGSPTIIQTPPPPPNPDQDPATIQKLADIATQRYQTEVVTPQMQAIQEQQQGQIPLEYGVTGFFPEQQQEYAQTATAQVSDLYSQTSVSAELAAQQSMFQAGMANLQAMTQAAQQRSQIQAAQYQAYAQQAPVMAMGFQGLFGQGNNQQQQFQAPSQGQGMNPSAYPGTQSLGGVV